MEISSNSIKLFALAFASVADRFNFQLNFDVVFDLGTSWS